MGQPQQASRALAHAVDFAQDGTPEFHVLKARQALLADDLNATEQELQQALKLNPNHLDALSASSRFYMGLDNGGAPDYATALPFSRKLFALNAAYDGARENLALNYYSLGDYQTALDLLAEELQIHPRNAQAWFYTGLIYNQLDRPDTAFMYMERAIAINPALRTPELDSVLKRD
jgi:tetratricopeptide (TPR) repeat protein